MVKWFVTMLVVLTVFAQEGSAGPLRDRFRQQHYQPQYQQQAVSYNYSYTYEIGSTVDALDEVNAARMARGLRPFIRDDGLTTAAFGAAQYRARYRMSGHINGGSGDFTFLPFGTYAGAAGCGAMEPHWGFQACCQWEGWTYAGAATVRGSDGKLYHHLFVR